MSREYEIKLELTSAEAIRIYNLIKNKLNGKQEFQKDRYYCPKNINIRRFMEKRCIRIRVENEKKMLDYKEIEHENNTIFQKLIEYSTEIEDENCMDMILQRLGLILVLSINKERIECIYKEMCKIAIDKVEKLGWFIEIELINYDGDELTLENRIKEIIEDLNIENIRINKIGYSNMMLNLIYGEE